MNSRTPASRSAPATARLSNALMALATVVVVAAAIYLLPRAAAEQAVKLPPPAADVQAASGTAASAVFAGGCFWGVQAVFQHTQGVLSAVSGYAGGSARSAHYEMVASGSTGHAEAVRVTWDPSRISYGKLLQIYFSIAHDPTQLDRQGPDTGPQYRSAIFYVDAKQQDVAQRYIAQLDAARVFQRKIVTRLAPLDTFYPAEDYHQDYATRHPDSPYIAAFDRPKIDNLKSMLPQWYRAQPVLVGRRQG